MALGPVRPPALALISIVALTLPAVAQDGALLINLENEVVTAAQGWETTVMQAARSLFWILAGIEVGIAAVWLVEWAFYHLLLNAKDEPARFGSLFDEAVSRSAEVGRDYTAIHPHQEHLLDIAIEIGQRPAIERLAGKIADRHPAKKATKDLLKRAAAFLAKQT